MTTSLNEPMIEHSGSRLPGIDDLDMKARVAEILDRWPAAGLAVDPPVQLLEHVRGRRSQEELPPQPEFLVEAPKPKGVTDRDLRDPGGEREDRRVVPGGRQETKAAEQPGDLGGVVLRDEKTRARSLLCIPLTTL